MDSYTNDLFSAIALRRQVPIARPTTPRVDPLAPRDVLAVVSEVWPGACHECRHSEIGWSSVRRLPSAGYPLLPGLAGDTVGAC
jgi:hypothetical protein